MSNRTRPLQDLLRSPGRLCVNPTDLSTAYPHGGSDLGNIRACAARPVVTYYSVTAEEFGGRVVESTHKSRGEVLAVVFRGATDKALEILYPNSEVGAETGKRLVFSAYPTDDDSFRAGYRMTEKAVTLCFSPDDRTTKGVTVLLQKAIPMLEESMELALQTNRDVEHAAVFQCVPLVSGGRPYQQGHWRDMTLGAEPEPEE